MERICLVMGADAIEVLLPLMRVPLNTYGASGKNYEFSGNKNTGSFKEPGFSSKTPAFFTGPTILQVPGS